MEIVDQLVQIAGAIAILTAFILVQAGRLDPASLPYLVLNLVGSFVLAVDAAIGREWGFLLLEGVWAVVSAISLIRVLRGGRSAGAAPAH
jgi:hypothetical protein